MEHICGTKFCTNCVNNMVLCPKCRIYAKYIPFTDTTYNERLNNLVVICCECNYQFKRSQLDEHCELCPMKCTSQCCKITEFCKTTPVLLDCPAKRIGCIRPIYSQQYYEHIQNCQFIRILKIIDEQEKEIVRLTNCIKNRFNANDANLVSYRLRKKTEDDYTRLDCVGKINRSFKIINIVDVMYIEIEYISTKSKLIIDSKGTMVPSFSFYKSDIVEINYNHPDYLLISNGRIVLKITSNGCRIYFLMKSIGDEVEIILSPKDFFGTRA